MIFNCKPKNALETQVDHKKKFKQIVDYLDLIPNIDQKNQMIYFLNITKNLPNSTKYDREFEIHSCFFYDNTNLIFFRSQDKETFTIKGKNIGLDYPIIKYNTREEIRTIIEEIIDNEYVIFGFISQDKDISNKELIFRAKFENQYYTAITNDNKVMLFPEDFYIEEDKLYSKINKFPVVYERKLENGERDIYYVSAIPHKIGACRTIFLDDKKRKISSFKYYLCVLRLDKDNFVQKVYISCKDCEKTQDSKVIN